VQVKHIDFSTYDVKGFDLLMQYLHNYDIGLVVNNVGVFQAITLSDMDAKSILRMFNINMLTPTLITRQLVPKLRCFYLFLHLNRTAKEIRRNIYRIRNWRVSKITFCGLCFNKSLHPSSGEIP
jgi:NAD(P)-dependent dehydrogenase (short-subunit alcohol dehydrogenase family)